ncbi:GSCOCG00013433001-RA-CDS [Cotesia congregata]|uniref:Similar to Znf580: Zinc finger protein 580 (Mus musculus) n=1 Tax=Cotesia congregata TaxID=51543 RepID=A0A8J2EKE6_COTCN|nr:GSCOCG00013433001-RA-CDS [Cotesia congregata]CAG5075878.1 Similar to Znf580: Zinc finger protein 580 (Mus musculus) [Cotesia congregata]
MKTPDKDNGDNSEQTIIYLNELCRLCLARKKTMVPIYDGHKEDVPIPVKLMACVNLEVYKGDGLPTKLCQTCKDNLDQSYQFRKKCHDAHKKLNNHKQIIADLNAESEDNNEESLETPEIEKSLPVKQQLSQEDQQIVSSLPSGSATAKKQNSEEIYNIKLVRMKREEESMIRESSDLTDIISDYNSADGSTWDGNNYVYTMEESEEGGSEAPGRLEPLEENTTSENGELKVFKCDQCPKAFTRRIMLKSHQTVHSTQRGFTCQACEKWFPTRSALIRHERTHTGKLFIF